MVLAKSLSSPLLRYLDFSSATFISNIIASTIPTHMLSLLLLSSSLFLSSTSASPVNQVSFSAPRMTGPLTRVFTPTNYTIVDGCEALLLLCSHSQSAHSPTSPQTVFHQSSSGYNASDWDPLKHSFGLRDTSKERWSRFQTEIDRLNEESDGHTAYKVFFVARHGQGWHNVSRGSKEAKLDRAYESSQTANRFLRVLPHRLQSQSTVQMLGTIIGAWNMETGT